MIFCDTHVLLRLKSENLKTIPLKIRRQIESAEALYYPNIVRLELSYLHEIGRTIYTPDEVLLPLGEELGLYASPHSFEQVCIEAVKIGWTRDVFDRLIVADAMCANAKLITADSHIHKHYKKAIW